MPVVSIPCEVRGPIELVPPYQPVLAIEKLVQFETVNGKQYAIAQQSHLTQDNRLLVILGQEEEDGVWIILTPPWIGLHPSHKVSKSLIRTES